MTQTAPEVEIDPSALEGLDEPVLVPWHAILAPEGVQSGDRRKFKAGALTWRDLPLPLAHQEVTAEGHEGSRVVGRIDGITRAEGQMRAWGVFDSHEHADEAVRQIAEGFLRGVSVDVDSAEFAFFDELGNDVSESSPLDVPNPIMVVEKGRISGATLCAIPAFQEAWISLGEPPDSWGVTTGLPETEPVVTSNSVGLVPFISDRPWDGSASRFTPEQWKRSTVLHVCDGMEKSCHKLPIREPGGELSRAGVHAAAARLNQVDAPPAAKSSARSALRGAYRQLGEEPPDVLKGATDDLEEFVGGQPDAGIPGHMPRVLHSYWTHGPGAAKINWGVPGDFNRCRALLGKYVSPRMLSGLCAKLHNDAVGHWPGPGRGNSGETLDLAEGTSLTQPCDCTLTASAGLFSDFDDPALPGPTPLTITEEGRVFGHLAVWGTCHIGFNGQCVTPPSSHSRYSYFTTGAVLTNDGVTVPVGQITLGTGHASPHLEARPAAAHYDDTGVAVADVAAGEDAYGIWIAGRVRPEVTPAQVDMLRAAALSGDWRRIGGRLELVAALAVNVPGFPIPRTRSALADGAQTSLVASGIVKPGTQQSEDARITALLSAALRADRAQQARLQKARRLAASIGRDPVARRAELDALVHG